MKITIGKKLGISFAIIVGVMILSALFTFKQLNSLQAVEERVTTLRFPTVIAGRDLFNGINSSLAALRGYMILGDNPKLGDKMKLSRNEAWANIDKAVAQFNTFSQGWTVPDNVARLNEMKVLLAEFKQAQTDVESISHTSDNIPAFAMLLNEAAPRAAEVLKALTALINEEENLTANAQRKALLKNLADSRGSFAIGLASIRAYLLSGNDKYRVQFEEKWQVNEAVFQKLNKQVSLLNSTQQESWQIYASMREEFSPFPAKMFTLRTGSQWNQANFLLATEAAPRAAKIKAILMSMKASQEKLVANDLALLNDTNSATVMTLIIATVLATVAAIGIAILLSFRMTKTITSVLERAQNIASNNLSEPPLVIDSQDELGELTKAMNTMSSSLNKVVNAVKDAAEEVSLNAAQVATGNAQIAAGMLEQNEQVAKVSTAIEEMSNSTSEVARNSNEAATNASDTENMANQGRDIVENSVECIRAIEDVVNQATESVKQLGVRGEEIGTITGVINGIADQTNLLALNAAIEAARAGEHGRGFAVVADEVRQLAKRTVEATEEIKQSIHAMQGQTTNVIEQMINSTEEVQHGVQLAEEAGESLTNIVTNVKNVSTNIQSIASVGEEQSHVASEISQNVDSIATVTEQSSNTTAETELITSQMSEKTAVLMKVVQRFKLTG